MDSEIAGSSRGNEDASVLEILSDAFQLATLEGKMVMKNLLHMSARYVAALQIRLFKFCLVCLECTIFSVILACHQCHKMKRENVNKT